jgi:hypothetical protein
MELNFVEEKHIKTGRRYAIDEMITEIRRSCPVGHGMSRAQILEAIENDEKQLVEILIRQRLHKDAGDGKIAISRKMMRQQPEFQLARRRWYKNATEILKKISLDQKFKIKRNADGGMIGFVRIKK